MELAPIVLFVYRRPDQTKEVLEALSKNDLASDSILYVFADGPKDNASQDDLAKILYVEEAVLEKKWFSEVIFIKRSRNFGLAENIISGVSEVISKHGKAIVLEDDLITSKYFLLYMNDALSIYADDPKVISVGACNFFARHESLPDTFFIPIPDCWGWGTWREKWKLFERNGKVLLDRLIEKSLIEKFNLYGRYNFVGMLIDQINGRNNSWAIRWQAVAYLHEMLSLYPKYSMVRNIGFDSDATHGGTASLFENILLAPRRLKVLKIDVKENSLVTSLMYDTYSRLFGPKTPPFSPMSNLKRVILKFLPPILLDVRNYFVKQESGIAKTPKSDLQWTGSYMTWEDAIANSSGYDSDTIFKKISESTLKVKEGKAAYERDSVLFDKPEYSWPLLTVLLKIAMEKNNSLNVLDFGGSLGSSYFQNRKFLESLNELLWSVVEQQHYIAFGNEKISDGSLKFYYSIEECIEDRRPTVLLLSGVIQYLENPYKWLRTFTEKDFEYILFDRTSFILEGNDQLTVQKVPDSIYKASYPAWFLNKDYLLDVMSAKYEFVIDFNNGITPDIQLNGKRAFWNGLVFKRKSK